MSGIVPSVHSCGANCFLFFIPSQNVQRMRIEGSNFSCRGAETNWCALNRIVGGVVEDSPVGCTLVLGIQGAQGVEQFRNCGALCTPSGTATGHLEGNSNSKYFPRIFCFGHVGGIFNFGGSGVRMRGLKITRA